MSQKLSQNSLDHLHASIARPTYDRAGLSAGILHIGVGNFHRAHQAAYLDKLFNLGLDHDWALIGAGVRANDTVMRECLAGQDYLTTLVELAPTGHRAQVIGSMIDFVPVGADNSALITAMSRPEIRIVSLTVTEGGYYLNTEGLFDVDHPDMKRDAAHPQSPSSAFGAIIAALKIRHAASDAPFTVMSCDNLPGNGHVAQNTITGLARLSDPDFAAWIGRNVAFPNGMVDRITPATGDRERALLVKEFGIEDAAPVLCEPYTQWVLEDNFPTGRPTLEKVGVTFTDQVEAFEAMKIRILNGGHAVIAYPAGLMDIEFVHEAMADPLIGAFLDKIERQEILPVVAPVLDTDLNDYLELIVERFSNPDIGDTVQRLCLDGSNRQPKFILPSVRDNLANGHFPEGLCLLSALWRRYCHGETESGVQIPPNDPNWHALKQRARKARNDPRVWLQMQDVYGDLSEASSFSDRFAEWLTAIWKDGTEAALKQYLAG